MQRKCSDDVLNQILADNADDELMQKLEEFYVSKFMFNPFFVVCSGSFSKDDA
nr:MAG TPA: hypothetical protein [Microviridae sp.]